MVPEILASHNNWYEMSWSSEKVASLPFGHERGPKFRLGSSGDGLEAADEAVVIRVLDVAEFVSASAEVGDALGSAAGDCVTVDA